METKKEYQPLPEPQLKRDPQQCVNIDELPPEQQAEIIRAFQRFRINIGRSVLESNPGLDKVQ